MQTHRRVSRSLAAALGALPLACLLAAPACPSEGRALSQAASVGPWAALTGSEGLDLRDESNRPISREALRRELRSADEASRRQTLPLSRLRHASLFRQFLDRLFPLASALRAEGSGGASREECSAFSPPREPKPALPAPGLRSPSPDAGLPVFLSDYRPSDLPGRLTPMVLRC